MKYWWQQYLLAGLGVLLMGGFGFFFLRGYLLDETEANAFAGLEEIKEILTESLDDPRAFRQTIRRNGDRFQCLRQSGIACRGKGGLFVVYANKENRGVPISQLSSERGLMRNLASCNDFPSINCPYHVEAAWSAIGDDTSCDGKRPLRVLSRVVLNTGTLYHEWKLDRSLTASVDLTPRARCECEGKDWQGDRCEQRQNLANDDRDTGRSPASDRDEETVDETGMKAEENQMVLPDCPNHVNFRGEQFVVVGVDSLGQAEILLPGEDNRCNMPDRFRFQCVSRTLASGQAVGEWVFTGVTRGECVEPTPSTLDTTDMTPPRVLNDDEAGETSRSGRAPGQGQDDQIGDPGIVIQQGSVSDPAVEE